MKRYCLLLLLLCGVATPALAHKASDSFLYLSQGELRLDVALQDLLRLVPLDRDGDGDLSWGEIQDGASEIEGILLRDITLSQQDRLCSTELQLVGISQHSDGPYAVWNFASSCLNDLQALELDYRLLFERDPLHRGLYVVAFGGQQRPGVLSPDNPRLAVSETGNAFATVKAFFWQGGMHLLTGYDHMLFLLALLLPVLGRHREQTSLSACGREILWIVSMFTLAHSITLTLATLGWVQLPSRPVEIAIALSVSLAAVLSLMPLQLRVQMALALGFGLVHGFGFAGMLAGLLSQAGSRALALLSFNMGIEVAQIAVVAVLMPLFYPLRNYRFFRHLVVPGIALAIAMVGLLWAVSR